MNNSPLIVIAVLVVVFAILLKIFQNIIILDSVVFGIFGGIVLSHFVDWHLLFIILSGIALGFLMAFIQSTTVGFWIVSSIISSAWAFFAASAVYSATNDYVWTVFGFIAALAIMIMLHMHARSDMGFDTIAEPKTPTKYYDRNEDIRELNRTMKRVADNMENANFSNRSPDDPLPEPTVYAEAVGVDEDGTTIYEVKN